VGGFVARAVIVVIRSIAHEPITRSKKQNSRDASRLLRYKRNRISGCP